MSLQNIGSMKFRDRRDGDVGLAFIRVSGDKIGIALSLKNAGDAEVFMDLGVAGEFLDALKRALDIVASTSPDASAEAGPRLVAAMKFHDFGDGGDARVSVEAGAGTVEITLDMGEDGYASVTMGMGDASEFLAAVQEAVVVAERGL